MIWLFAREVFQIVKQVSVLLVGWGGVGLGVRGGVKNRGAGL